MEEKENRQNLSIKSIISNDYTIICDTNVFLRLYDYSPEFVSFAIECLKRIENCMKITYTTRIEFNKHYRQKYGNAKKKIININSKLLEQIENAERKIMNEINRVQQYNFPDLDQLQNNIQQKISEIKAQTSEYLENHELLSAVNDNFLQNDSVKDFWDSLSANILPSFSYNKLYDICEDGQQRFEKNIPPGYKDKEKKGLRQFCDLILWNEIISYSIATKKNVLFITDDIKEDWWTTIKNIDGTITKVFHDKLIFEFNQKTGQTIQAMQSAEFFAAISREYNIQQQNIVEMALAQTNDSYIQRIQCSVFDSIIDDLAMSGEQYIVGDNNIGTESLSEFEIDYHDCTDYEIIERQDTNIIYVLTYNVTLLATSTEYWGRDDDTHEIIESPPNEHIFEGKLKVQVERVLNDFVDLLYEYDFDNSEIYSCELEETKFIPYYEEEGSYDDQYNICSYCGKPISWQNDAGNSYCKDCTDKYDL